MKTIIISGGAGFVGSAVAKKAIADGYEICILDDLSTGFRHNIPPQCAFVEGDIVNFEAFSGLPKKNVLAFFHIAGQSSGEISHENPARDLDVNARGTLNALEWCRRNGVKRFMYASSMSVYGKQPLDLPVREDAPLRPESFYGCSKLASEHLLRIYGDQHGIDWTALRMFNVYGPGQNLHNLKQGMVSIYLAYLVAGKPILVKGSLDRFRDFVFIDDVVNIWMECLENAGTIREIFNLGFGKPVTVRSLLGLMFKIFNGGKVQDNIQEANGTPGDLFGIYADTTKLNSVFRYRLSADLQAGLSRMIEWAREPASVKGLQFKGTE